VTSGGRGKRDVPELFQQVLVMLLDFSPTELAKRVFCQGEGELRCGVACFCACAGREGVFRLQSSVFLC
jgi:hypothetical protein